MSYNKYVPVVQLTKTHGSKRPDLLYDIYVTWIAQKNFFVHVWCNLSLYKIYIVVPKTCILFTIYITLCMLTCSSLTALFHSLFAQHEDNFPPKVEEETELDDVEKIKEATDTDKLFSRVQELEDELQVSEQKRMDLIQGNTALQTLLKACQKKEGCARQEIASLKERLLSVLSSKVRTAEGWSTRQTSRVLHIGSPWATMYIK